MMILSRNRNQQFVILYGIAVHDRNRHSSISLFVLIVEAILFHYTRIEIIKYQRYTARLIERGVYSVFFFFFSSSLFDSRNFHRPFVTVSISSKNEREFVYSQMTTSIGHSFASPYFISSSYRLPSD